MHPNGRNYMLEPRNQGNEIKKCNSQSMKTIAVGKFVYNRGYDTNFDDCLLNYLTQADKGGSVSIKKQEERGKEADENKIEKALKKYWKKRLGNQQNLIHQ